MYSKDFSILSVNQNNKNIPEKKVMDRRFYFVLFLCLIPKLCSSQDYPTICLEQGACYQGSWLNSDNKR